MLKSNIDVFFVKSYLCSLYFLFFHRKEYPKRSLRKINYGSVFVIWLYLQKAMYRLCDLWHMKVFFLDLVNCVQPYKYPVYISDRYLYSREIKFQTIGRTHTQTHTQTDRHTHRQTHTDRVKTIPRNPLRGRKNGIMRLRHTEIRLNITVLYCWYTRVWQKNYVQFHNSHPGHTRSNLVFIVIYKKNHDEWIMSNPGQDTWFPGFPL